MNPSSDLSYFDLHITGLGYLNRIREVQPRKGDAFLACDIAALNGPSDSPDYRRFDVRVSGSEAQHPVDKTNLNHNLFHCGWFHPPSVVGILH